MCAALVGGMDRLKRDYMNEAKKNGVKLKCYTGKGTLHFGFSRKGGLCCTLHQQSLT